MHGGGLTGVGEDVVYQGDEQLQFQQAGPVHDSQRAADNRRVLRPDRTAGSVPSHPVDIRLRRSFEFGRLRARHSISRCCQTRRRLLGRTRPHGKPDDARRLDPAWRPAHRRARDQTPRTGPDLRFKLDATSSWTPELFEQLVSTGAVDSIDFKGMYEAPPLTSPPTRPLPARRRSIPGRLAGRPRPERPRDRRRARRGTRPHHLGRTDPQHHRH